MTRRTSPEDPRLRETCEWGVLAPILLATPEVGSRLLAAASVALAPPLHRWFDDRPRKAIAVAMDAALRGEIQPDHQSVAGYLGGMPYETLIEITTGRPVAPWKASEYQGSALAAIGGFNSLDAPDGLQGNPALVAGSATLLRHLVERLQAVETLREVAVEVSRCDLKGGPTEALSAGLDRLAGLLSGGSAGRNMGDCLLSAIDRAEQSASLRAQGQSVPCTWGLPALDLLCPLRPGMLVVLSAPPGAGKTSLALQAGAATAAVGGKGSVAISSLEMTGEEVATILVARELQISPSSIREWTQAAQSRADQIRAIAQQWRASDAVMIRDLETGGQRQTAAAVTAWLRQRKTVTANRLGLGIIDYLQLLDGEPRQREYDTITQATRTLKRTALSLRIPILCLAQMNREGRKADRNQQGEVTTVPEPRLEDLKGSGSIEQDADAVVFIHFPETKDPVTWTGRIIVAKQRGGATGSIAVNFHRRHQLMVHQGPVPESLPRPSDERFAGEPTDAEDHFFGGGQ